MQHRRTARFGFRRQRPRFHGVKTTGHSGAGLTTSKHGNQARSVLVAAPHGGV